MERSHSIWHGVADVFAIADDTAGGWDFLIANHDGNELTHPQAGMANTAKASRSWNKVGERKSNGRSVIPDIHSMIPRSCRCSVNLDFKQIHPHLCHYESMYMHTLVIVIIKT